LRLEREIPIPTYNKLVRDRIPEVIRSTGKKFSTRILNDNEYITELKTKSFEELQEYVETVNNEDAIEELANLLEIIHALAEYHGSFVRPTESLTVFTQQIGRRLRLHDGKETCVIIDLIGNYRNADIKLGLFHTEPTDGKGKR
jgi:predicted house-cleaning noncanonical NTP pyrophosphatase (MazG superfamily)